MSARVHRATIAGGDRGTRQTLAAMAGLVRSSLAVPRVLEWAHRIVRDALPHDPADQARAVRAWLGAHFQFVGDPVDQETLRDPDYQLRQWEREGVITGDCDDAAILGAALGEAVGIPASFRAIALADGSRAPAYSHVFAVLLPEEGPEIDLDVTAPRTAVPPAVRILDWPI